MEGSGRHSKKPKKPACSLCRLMWFRSMIAAILPATMVLLLVVHITLIRLQGVTEFKFEDDAATEDHFNFFPDHLYTEVIMGLILSLGALIALWPRRRHAAQPVSVPIVPGLAEQQRKRRRRSRNRRPVPAGATAASEVSS